MWSLALMLASAQAEPPEILPLAVGHTWVYELREKKGGGVRFLGMRQKSATNIKLADWTYAITAKEGEQYLATLTIVPAEGLTTTAQMRLWERDGQVWTDAGQGERLAIEAIIPPNPVSSERIRCVAHMLGGVVGKCPPVSGGPKGVTPGLHEGIVGADVRQGAGLAQVLVGIATVGTLIPGNQSSYERLRLKQFTAGEGAEIASTESAFFSAVQSGGSSPSQLARHAQTHPPDAEGAAAVVAQAGSRDPAMAALLPHLSASDQHPVLRTALQHSSKPLVTMAHASGLLKSEPTDDEWTGLLAPFGNDKDRGRARLVLSGGNPLFVAMLLADDTFDHDRISTLERELPAHPVTVEQAIPVLEVFSFDDGRSEAIELLLAGVPEEQRGAALLVWVPILGFDDAKIELMTRHLEALKALPADQRQLLVEDSSFKKDEVRALLGL
ncbi:MAG: DUF4476 domain-containing protein [Proteobacteria bacterium]|nr:DUF4476 domain-containing protein [Pseudomonadota bacterium]